VSGRKEKKKKKKYLLAVSMKKKEIPPVAVPATIEETTAKSISLFMSLAVDKQY
jgi:hypothetical protein